MNRSLFLKFLRMSIRHRLTGLTSDRLMLLVPLCYGHWIAFLLILYSTKELQRDPKRWFSKYLQNLRFVFCLFCMLFWEFCAMCGVVTWISRCCLFMVMEERSSCMCVIGIRWSYYFEEPYPHHKGERKRVNVGRGHGYLHLACVSWLHLPGSNTYLRVSIQSSNL